MTSRLGTGKPLTFFYSVRYDFCSVVCTLTFCSYDTLHLFFHGKMMSLPCLHVKGWRLGCPRARPLVCCSCSGYGFRFSTSTNCLRYSCYFHFIAGLRLPLLNINKLFEIFMLFSFHCWVTASASQHQQIVSDIHVIFISLLGTILYATTTP